MTTALLDAIAESPNDDGPRLVYADWLLQQTDEADRARGEYISLACSTARNAKRSLRMKELFDRHATAWLGPLAAVTDPSHRLWARGFLDGCDLARNTAPAAVDAAVGHPAWRVLRVLATALPAPTWEVTRLICQRETANLKALHVPQWVLPQIVESALAPRVLELAVAPSGEPLAQLFPLLAADCFARLRKLHVYHCSPAMLPQLMRPGLTLIAAARLSTLAIWVAELEALRASLPEVRLVSGVHPLLERHGYELVLRHDADHRWNRLEVRWAETDDRVLRDEIILAASRLPEGAITRVSFVGPPTTQFDLVRWKQRIITALGDVIVE